MCCSNSGNFFNSMNNGCCCMPNYNCFFTPHCGCNNGFNNGGFFNNGFGGGGWGSSLELIALFSLLCR